MDTLHSPLGTGMIAKCSFLGLIGGSIYLRESAVSMSPLVRGNDREHLTTLQGHFDNVFIGEANSTFSRPRRSHKNVHNQKQNFLRTYFTFSGLSSIQKASCSICLEAVDILTEFSISWSLFSGRGISFNEM